MKEIDNNKVEILIAGDLIPNVKTLELIKKGKVTEFAPDVSEIIKQGDISIVNLETPLTKNKKPIEKLGYNFMAHSDNVELIKRLGFDTVTLANNHILDQDEQGVLDTINTCHAEGVKTVGAGKNLEDAKKPLIIDIKNKKVGIINLCEQEFSIATENSAGANPYNPINAYYQITDLKKKVEILIVLIHGGLEYHHIPLRAFKNQCKYMIDLGADVVVGHHTHYFSGFSYYKSKPMFFSLGNFYSDSNRQDKNLYNSYLVRLKFSEKLNITHEIIGIEIEKDIPRIRLKTVDENNNICYEIESYNKIINSEKKLKKYWRSKSSCILKNYNRIINSKSKFVSRLKKRVPFLNKVNDYQLLNVFNILRCQSHREAFLDSFQNRENEINE